MLTEEQADKILALIHKNWRLSAITNPLLFETWAKHLPIPLYGFKSYEDMHAAICEAKGCDEKWVNNAVADHNEQYKREKFQKWADCWSPHTSSEILSIIHGAFAEMGDYSYIFYTRSKKNFVTPHRMIVTPPDVVEFTWPEELHYRYGDFKIHKSFYVLTYENSHLVSTCNAHILNMAEPGSLERLCEVFGHCMDGQSCQECPVIGVRIEATPKYTWGKCRPLWIGVS